MTVAADDDLVRGWKGVAEVLQVHPLTAMRALRRGIPVYHDGRSIVASRQELRLWLLHDQKRLRWAPQHRPPTAPVENPEITSGAPARRRGRKTAGGPATRSARAARTM